MIGLCNTCVTFFQQGLDIFMWWKMTKSKYLAIKPENKFNGNLVRDVCEELQSSRDCNLRDQDLLQSGTLRLWQRVQDRDLNVQDQRQDSRPENVSISPYFFVNLSKNHLHIQTSISSSFVHFANFLNFPSSNIRLTANK